jgi:hypothetical protein
MGFVSRLPSEGGDYVSAVIALPAHYGFTPEVVAAFSDLAGRLQEAFGEDEGRWIRAYQLSESDSESAWTATESSLDIVVPRRLLARLKEEFERVLRETPEVLREIPVEEH